MTPQSQQSNEAQRLVPHDIAAEEAVIASLMVSEGIAKRIATLLAPSDFFREKNARIFAAELQLVKRDALIDTISVASVLHNAHQLEAVGGVAYLMQLVTDLPTSIGVEWYAERVKQTALYRKLVSAGSQIAQLGFSDSSDLLHTLLRAQHCIAALQNEANDFIRAQFAADWNAA